MFLLVIFLLLFSVEIGQSLPTEYRQRGTKSYLVNYNAIRGNIFQTRLAHKRFSFLDEASQKEINFIRRSDSNYLILFYKDAVALNTYLPEFSKMMLEEDAFLHSSEPSCFTVLFDKGWKFHWLRDRRFDTNVNVAYKLYWAFDSSGSYVPVDTITKSTELNISLPKSARWVLLKTIVNDTNEFPYSFPVKLFYEDSIPQYVPLKLNKSVTSNSTTIEILIRLVSSVRPDSVYLFFDVNKNNIFDEKPIAFVERLDTLGFSSIYFDNVINAGVELYLVCYKDGKQYRIPKQGFWTTNPNNRIKNEEYNFYVMDIANQKWRKNYIEQVLKAFERGYNGLFVDDAWYRVSTWGVDVYPPINYSDSLWFSSMLEFLDEIKQGIGNRTMFFNGLYANEALRFLEVTDGGMDEGFAYTHWSGYVTGNNWRMACDRGIKCQNEYGKEWLALGGIQNNAPEPRLYCLASYLLVAGDKSYFANAINYQNFAYYPEFDIPIGNPLQSPQNTILELEGKDAQGKIYYLREFENCKVYVNPSKNDTVILAELDGAPQIYTDTLPSVDGGRLFTTSSASMLKPMSAKIILKGAGSKLTSPMVRNAKVIIAGMGKDGARIVAEAECADSSSSKFKSDSTLPMYVYADLSELGVLEELELKNDGTAASSNYSAYRGETIIPLGANLKNVKIPIVVFSTTGLMTVAYASVEIRNIDTSNAVPNFSFEYDVDLDGKPDAWKPYRKGYIYDTTGLNAQHLRRSIKVVNATPEDTGGAYTTIYLNQQNIGPILVSGWSKAENVSGKSDNDYSIYVDFFRKDGQPWYGRSSRFSTGTHDWEYTATIYYYDQPVPLERGNVYCLFRGHTGTVWFDNIFVGQIDSSAIIVEGSNKAYFRAPSVVTGKESDVVIISNVQPTVAKIVTFNTLGEKSLETDIQLENETNVIPLYFLTRDFPNGVHFLEINLGDRIYVYPFLILR
ncbi:MAG: putative glycoside hydrolase [Candidatus Kapaibacteriota bacterium]